MIKKIVSQIPNTITCLNLLSGCLAIWCTFLPNTYINGLMPYQWTALFIGCAALFDFCDGAAARALKAYSNIGKELDSLADLVSFGVAPAMLIGNMMLANGAPVAVAAIAPLIAVLGGVRLAKFNCDTRQTTSFIGLPIPANAIFWIGFTAWCMNHGYPGNIATPIIVLAVSLLMVSELPMFSLKFKNMNFTENIRRYTILAGALLFVIFYGLEGLMWTILLYLLMCVIRRK